VWYAE